MTTNGLSFAIVKNSETVGRHGEPDIDLSAEADERAKGRLYGVSVSDLVWNPETEVFQVSQWLRLDYAL